MDTMAEKHWIKCFAGSGLRHLLPEAVLFDAGDIPLECYVVLEGHLVAVYEKAKDVRRVVACYKEGDLILAENLISARDSIFTYMAITNATVRAVSYKEVFRFMAAGPQYAAELIEQIQKNSEDIFVKLLDSSDVTCKVADVFLDLAKTIGTEADRSLPLEAKLTQEMIAGYTGLHRVSVTKELKKLRSLGIVYYRDGKYYIPDLKALEDYKNGRFQGSCD